MQNNQTNLKWAGVPIQFMTTRSLIDTKRTLEHPECDKSNKIDGLSHTTWCNIFNKQLAIRTMYNSINNILYNVLKIQKHD